MNLVKLHRKQEQADWKSIQDAVVFLRESRIPDDQDVRNKIADALDGIFNRLKSLENLCALIEPDED